MSRMDDHVHGLVQDQQVIVFVNDVQIHRLRQQLKFKYRLRQLNRHHIPGLDFVVAFDGFTVDAHVARLRGRLQFVARQMCHQVDDEFVDAPSMQRTRQGAGR